jgi:solute carrier family 35 (UDP-sugar transporter), member A1/2/3
LLIAAAVLLSVGEGTNNGSTGANADQVLFYGIIPVLIASVLSGLASSLCQWASQVTRTFSFPFKPKFSEQVNVFLCPIDFFLYIAG